MKPFTTLITALAAAGCTATVDEQTDGTYVVTSDTAQSRALAEDAVVSRSAELCPGGYEVLFEDNDWGFWDYAVTRRIRCR